MNNLTDYALKSKSFEFSKNPEEDIYSLEDGNVLFCE